MTEPPTPLPMAEIDIDITGEHPKAWTEELAQAAVVVVTMGCGDACPLSPGKRYEDWELDDPAGHDLLMRISSSRRVRGRSRRGR